LKRYWGVTADIEVKAQAAAPRQVLMVALALLVCEWESTLSRNTWRLPLARDRRYLNALIGWDYKPSDVERLILAQPEADAEPTERGRAERRGRRHRRAYGGLRGWS